MSRYISEANQIQVRERACYLCEYCHTSEQWQTWFQVSEDPDKLIAYFLGLALSDYYIDRVEELFIPDGEGIDDLYRDVNIYAFRARHTDDLPEYTSGSITTQLIDNEVWVISASGFCYEAQPIIITGDELRLLIQHAKKVVKYNKL